MTYRQEIEDAKTRIAKAEQALRRGEIDESRLLDEFQGMSLEQRQAVFVCVVARVLTGSQPVGSSIRDPEF